MTMRIKFLLLFFLPLTVFSQEESKPYFTDSLEYYQRQLSEIQKRTQDSMRESRAYKDAMAGIERNRGKTNNYSGFVIFTGLMSSEYGAFNTSITQSGFDPIDALSLQFGFGISLREDPITFDVYYMAGSGATTKKGDEKISASVINFFQMDLGVNIVKARKLSVYPFLGLAYRLSFLEYEKPDELNTAFTNISDLVINDQSVNMNSSRIGYQAGVGMDVVISENKRNTSNIVLFTKAGISRPIWKDKYKFQGIEYNPGIKHGRWAISLGLKFCGRQ